MSLKKDLKRICKKRAKELIQHFTQDGWDVRPLTEQLILDEVGLDITQEIIKQGKGHFTYGFKRDEIFGGLSLVYYAPGAEYAIYNNQTNRIEVYRMDEDWPSDQEPYIWLGRI